MPACEAGLYGGPCHFFLAGAFGFLAGAFFEVFLVAGFFSPTKTVTGADGISDLLRIVYGFVMQKRDGTKFVAALEGKALAKVVSVAGVGVVVFQSDSEPILIETDGTVRKLAAGSITPELIEKARDDFAIFGASVLRFEFAD